MRRLAPLMASRPQHGLTIIELMVVMAVLAVLAALAAPSLREFMARQRLAAIASELVTDLQYARSESIARGRGVGVQFRTDGSDMTCYTIYTVGNTAGRCDCRRPLGGACPADVENLVELKTTQILRSTTVTLAPPGVASRVIFDGPQGQSSLDEFRVDVESSLSGKLRVTTNRLGRPQVCTPDGVMPGTTACPD